MRELFVSELAKEVLGPRNGATEVLDRYPPTEYITGVLTPILDASADPATATAETGIEAEASLTDIAPIEEPAVTSDEEYIEDKPAENEDDNEDVDVTAPPLLSPSLDPKSRPHSFGISFTLENNGVEKFHLCATWARYTAFSENDVERYTRTPHHAVVEVKTDCNCILYLDGAGNPCQIQQADVSIHVYSQERNHQEQKTRFISVYFVNRRHYAERPAVNDFIFQPEMRINLPANAKILPLEPIAEDSEDRRTNILYRERPALARGQLCSAVWKDIDPQVIPNDITVDFPSALEQPPFAWIDGQILDPQIYDQFKHASLRTEFLPVHSVPAPSFSWNTHYGPQPELRPSALAEIWTADEISHALEPIVNGYAQWIDELDAKAHALPGGREVSEKIIEECRRSLSRMKKGIALLKTDEQVRLSFCFANKAIQTQQLWSPGTELLWRPFQLGFMLMCIESVVNPRSDDREICDILWIATGGGKTEAYLALVAFTIAHRRRHSLCSSRDQRPCAGTSVITRYTLRLLTIQQFRRALKVITAAESLRVQNLGSSNPVGWRPAKCTSRESYMWGAIPFSIGLWVGGGVTPNKMNDTGMNGAIKGAVTLLTKPSYKAFGEPAQVTECPACNTTLAISSEGLKEGEHTLYLVVKNENRHTPEFYITRNAIAVEGSSVTEVVVHKTEAEGYFILEVKLEVETSLDANNAETIWADLLRHSDSNVKLVAASVARPGYFLRYYINENNRQTNYDFDIICPKPTCPLAQPWLGALPAGNLHGIPLNQNVPPPEADARIQLNTPDVIPVHVQQAFRFGSEYISSRIPINAYTVDYQIYAHAPTVLIATLDKFARLPFEPRAGTFFGNVEYHHEIYGYYRSGLHCGLSSAGEHPSPSGRGQRRHFRPVSCFRPPELILQDELHLIEGPLGSLAGIYETAVDVLCSEHGAKPKYIASSATIRKAEEQVAAIFSRDARVFPPLGLTVSDRFFVKEVEQHPLKDKDPGRLYMGLCAPGRGPLTPLRNIWARLLQTAHEQRDHELIDPYWTLTGYFNAVRELAGARALYRQDVPQRIFEIAGENQRVLPDDKGVELSSRISSTTLPYVLDSLNATGDAAPDALFTTSMFGTGIDIPRIGLMVVAGQPKTTASYIQSTGRVGRKQGALVVTFYRASRPRDLSHYEYFVAYHRQLHRYVEPVTVYPFSPGSIERALGPTAVFMLRNLVATKDVFGKDDQASNMALERNRNPAVQQLPQIMEARSASQPALRRPDASAIAEYMKSQLDKWQAIARNYTDLRYVEYSMNGLPQKPVVLGDAAHKHAKRPIVFDNVPQSLRDIEETTGFGA